MKVDSSRVRADRHANERHIWIRCRIAIALVLVVGFTTEGFTGEGQRGSAARVFNGVTASFRLFSHAIRTGEPLKVELTLRNTSGKTVSFRFTGPLVASIWVYDSAKRKLPFRMGSSLGEYPAATVELKPGAEFKTTLTGSLGDYYDLKPGKYYLRFIYDLRDISDPNAARRYMSEYHSENVVLWDTRWYRFSIRE